MRCQALCLLLYASIAKAQAQQGAAAATTCPTGAPGPNWSLPGWDMSNYLYVVYDETQPGKGVATTAHITFDIIGAFSNQRFHCESTGPDILANYTGPGSRWKTCTAKDTSTKSEYTTQFRYSPGDWYAVTLRETSLCGTDPLEM